jgi:hypothetical protein
VVGLRWDVFGLDILGDPLVEVVDVVVRTTDFIPGAAASSLGFVDGVVRLPVALCLLG